MSFVLVLLLSITVLVSVETKNASRSLDQLLARENARLGMMVAVGNLQKLAGPDQRVTARADILGDGNYEINSKFWTGIWTSDLAGGVAPSPVWLVSGDNPDPRVGAGTDFYVVFPATTNEPEVRVPFVEIGGAGSSSGNFAYWVSDEGVKASAVARRGAISQYESAELNDQRRITEYQSPFGVGLDSFFDGINLDLTDRNLANSLGKVTNFQDLLNISDSSGDPLVASAIEFLETEHNLTTVALGVLENPIDGGLKKNLSDTAFRDSFLATDETQEFLAVKGGFLDVESGLPSRRSFSGKPYHSPRPLLTEVVLYVGLFHTWSDAKIRIRYHIGAEFVNPYSLPLRFPSDSNQEYDRGVVLLFDNLPTITVEDLDLDSVAPTLTEDLNAFSVYAPTDSRHTINSWFEILPTSTPEVPVLNPGEIYQVTEPNPITQPRGLVRDFTSTRWSAAAQTRPDDDAKIRIRAEHPSGGLTITVVPYEGSGDFASRPPLTKIEGLVFADFVIKKDFRGGPSPFSRPTSGDYTILDYVFAYHFRIKSVETNTTSMRDILTAVDLRDPDLDAAELFTDIEGEEKAISELFFESDTPTDPTVVVSDDSNLFSALDQLYDETPRERADTDRNSVLFDMPDGEVLSVGQLSSLHIYRRKPRSIGSPWGEDFNEAFDRYYFSPKRVDPLTTEGMLSSPALLSLTEADLLANQDDAQNELTVGSFNINSTSVEAWVAVLASPVLTPEAADENLRGSSDVSRSAVFFRLPQFQAQENNFFVTPAQLQTPDRFFEQGIRSLNGTDGELQLRGIAVNIVEELKTRAEPFADMETFVNSGILRDAIDNVGSAGGTGTIPAINENLMEFSNVYLTQNDILTKIAPQATTRSDTFKIRAYGAAKDPITGEVNSSVWCEATVQRLPQKVDGTDPLSPATVNSPRKFQIISIRWSDEPS